jgi:ribonuclease-3
MNEIEQIFSYQFNNPVWLEQALAHKSYANEQRQGENNEKLEFIGDAVIDLVLAEALYQAFPDDAEGDLSKKRASLVNEAVLSDLAQELQVQRFVKLGRGEAQTGGESRPRLLASTLEALFGAVFMDGGYLLAQKVILEKFKSRLNDEILKRNFELDFKSRLQEIAQKKYREAPIYDVVEEKGAPHDRVFRVNVQISGKIVAEAEGRSKKEAEQKAARLALQTEGIE